MAAAVELQTQANGPVAEVEAGDEHAIVVVDLDLRLRLRETGKDEDQPEPGLHR